MALPAFTTWNVQTDGDAANGGGFVATPYTSAPDAPTVAALDGSGTVADGTYYVVFTYVDPYGDTIASAESSVVCSGNDDAIGWSSPATITNVYQYRVYIGTVSGGPYYIHNTYTIGTSGSRTTNPATSGAQPARTDYSKQVTAQLSISDAVSAGGIVINSVTGGFTQSMIGNVVNIATIGYRYIIGVTDTNSITVDAAVSAGTYSMNIGGATNHPQTIMPSIKAGNRMFVKSGTYVKVGANNYIVNCTVGGANNTPIYIEGYNTSFGDGSPTSVTLNGDSDSSGTGDTAYIADIDVNYYKFKNMTFTKSTTSVLDVSVASSISTVFENCRFTDGTTGINTPGANSQVFSFVNCEVDNMSGAGMYITSPTVTGTTLAFVNSYIHDNDGVGVGIDASGSFTQLVNSIVDANGSHGISGTIVTCINSVSNGNTGSGWYNSVDSTSTPRNIVLNSIFSNNTAYGIQRTSTGKTMPTICKDNCFYNNTSGDLLWMRDDSTNIHADPKFTNSAGGNFTLLPSSPCLSTGMGPTTAEGLTGTYNISIGAYQNKLLTNIIGSV